MIYFFSVSSIVLSLTTPFIRTWVKFNIANTDIDRDDDYTGSLFSLDKFYSSQHTEILKLENYPWDCIADKSCESNFDGMLCKTFEPLADSGWIYFNI